MNQGKNLLKYLLVTGLLFIMAQTKLYAGGLPVRPGSLTLSPSVTYFFANKGWDSVGRKSPFGADGKYQSITYSLYAEYGLSRRFSLIGYLPYTMANYTQTNFQNLNMGVTDLETGIKYYIGNIHYTYYFSLQATAVTPLYTNINLGYAQSGAELKLSFAGKGRLFDRNYYFNIDNALRQYFGSTGPEQYRYAGAFGLTLDRKFKQQISVSVGGFYSTSSFTKFIPNQLASNRDFAFTEVALSYGYAFGKGCSLFLSGGAFVAGRNTGQGYVSTLSLILRPF
jgi:hypothetical protein